MREIVRTPLKDLRKKEDEEKKLREKVSDLEMQNIDAFDSIAAVYEEQLESKTNNFEAIAELYELIVGGDSIE